MDASNRGRAAVAPGSTQAGGASMPCRDRSVWLAEHVLPQEPALRLWLQRRAPAGMDVDDLVQETYAVLSATSAVDHIASPRAYVFQTARSLILRHLRRARIVRFESLAQDLDEPEPADHVCVERSLAARDELRRVLAVVEALPPKCREAFQLRKLQGLSQRDVARAMGVSESTVEKHIGRALRAVTASLAADGVSIDGAPAARRGRESRGP